MINTPVDKTTENKSNAVANSSPIPQNAKESPLQFEDNRPVAIAQRKLQHAANTRSKASQPLQRKENKTGLPDQLKSGVEALSGHSMDDVKVHYNSSAPAQMQAHAYAQGTDIHLGAGQEKHLPHEAWHVAQQKQGRVKPTMQLKGKVNINDDLGLEKEADVMGTKAMSGAVQLKPEIYQLYSDVAQDPVQLKTTGQPACVFQFEEVDLTDDTWKETWYDKDLSAKSSTADTKYVKMLTELIGSSPKTELTEQLKGVDISTLKGDFLSALIQYYMHIAPYDPSVGKQGKDRAGEGYKYDSDYFRSNATHPVGKLYLKMLEKHGIKKVKAKAKKDEVAPSIPLNEELLSGLKANSKKAPEHNITSVSKGSVDYQQNKGRVGIASVGLPSNNLITMEQSQELALAPTASKIADQQRQRDLMMLPPVKDIKPKKDRGSRTLKGGKTEEALAAVAGTLSGQVAPGYTGSSFHDYMLADRGTLINKLGTAVNTKKTGTGISAIGAEEHPSLLLTGAGWKGKDSHNPPPSFTYDGTSYANTEDLGTPLKDKWNKGNTKFDVNLSERGSFGFLRPTVSDTADSMRFWPGYAPAEGLVKGLNKTIKPKGSSGGDVIDPSTVVTDKSAPVLHVEALKTAIRHVLIVLRKKLPEGLPAEKERVGKWLQTRLTINLHKANFLLSKVDNPSIDINQHYLKAAQVIDNLQENAFLYTSLTTEEQDGDSLTFANDDTDPYEKHIKATLASKIKDKGYTVFYLDSGEQAIASAATLANRFSQPTPAKKSAPSSPVATSYVNEKSYFELPFANKRFNMPDAVNPSTAKVISADLSPVITSPGSGANVSKATVDADINSKIAGKIPILDITNAALARLNNLTNMPDNFIIVESLTKHAQLGADKMLMGRLVAVGAAPFIEMAKTIVGPIAKGSYNSLAHAFRRNMDEASYTSNVSSGVLYQSSVHKSGSLTKGGSGAKTGSVTPAKEQIHGTTTGNTIKGISNLGNSCYLAAGLNMLAFNYAEYFTDDKAKAEEKAEITQLRKDVNAILLKIRAGVAIVTKEDVQKVVDKMGLLEVQRENANKASVAPSISPLVEPLIAIAETQKDKISETETVVVDLGAKAAEDERIRLEKVSIVKKETEDGQKLAKQFASVQQDTSDIIFGRLFNMLDINTAENELSETNTKSKDPVTPDVELPAMIEGDRLKLGENTVPAAQTQKSFRVELAIDGVDTLAAALNKYKNPKGTADFNYRAADKAYKTTLKEKIAFGIETPAVFTITLKRFDITGDTIEKIDNKVAMPEYFVLNNFKYDLSTVIYHHGAYGSGHYTSSTKEGDEWMYRNDSSVGKHTSFDHDKDLGYMYTYKKRDAVVEGHGLLVL